MKTFWKNICFSFTSLVIFLALAEIILRISGSIGYFNLPPYFEQVLDWPEYKMHIKISSQGLRDREFSTRKPPRTYRILSVGDSFSFGLGVEAEETYAKLLEKKLNAAFPGRKFEVINAGRARTGPNQYLRNIEELGKAFHPDMVMVGFYTGNDVRNVLDDMSRKDAYAGVPWIYRVSDFLTDHFRLYAFLKKIKNYVHYRIKKRISRQRVPRKDEKPPDEREKAIYRDLSEGKMDPALERAWEKARVVFRLNPDLVRRMYQNTFSDNSDPKMREALKRTFLLIKKMRDKSKALGAEFVLLVIPPHVQVDPVYSAFYSRFIVPVDTKKIQEAKIQQLLADFCRAEGIEYLDLLPAFRKHKEELTYYLMDGHWNQAGHRLAAEEIFRFLRAPFSASSQTRKREQLSRKSKT